MGQTDLTGTCHCGRVQYRVTADAIDAFFCHCEDCRKNSGAPYVAWGRIDQNAFEVTHGALKHYSSSPSVTRGFCPACGTGITYQHDDIMPDLDFQLVTLESADAIAPTYHIQVAEKLPWIHLDNDLPNYERWRPAGD